MYYFKIPSPSLYSLGVIFIIFLNTFEKFAAVSYPTIGAISLIFSDVFSKVRMLSFTRSSRIASVRFLPVKDLNPLERYDGFKCSLSESVHRKDLRQYFSHM